MRQIRIETELSLTELSLAFARAEQVPEGLREFWLSNDALTAQVEEQGNGLITALPILKGIKLSQPGSGEPAALQSLARWVESVTRSQI